MFSMETNFEGHVTLKKNDCILGLVSKAQKKQLHTHVILTASPNAAIYMQVVLFL